MNKYKLEVVCDAHTTSEENNRIEKQEAARTVYDSVSNMIEEYGMLQSCKHLVIGLSGGADSVCLLLMMQEYISRHHMDITIHCVHVHHGIRGEEADRDMHFSEELCKTLKVDFRWEQVDIPSLAKEKKQTEEEAGRNARYAIFHNIADLYEESKIAVAHHMNDQAETVLMNLIRGSSLRGMCGILPVRDNVIRPLLQTTRSEVEECLVKIGQEYVTDQTNNDTDYTRNRMRREIIPAMESHVNPQAVRRIAQMAASIQEAEQYIQKKVDQAYEESVTLTRTSEEAEQDSLMLRGEISTQLDPIIAKGVIQKALTVMARERKDLYRANVEDVYDLFTSQVNKRISLPYKLYARKCYDGVIIGHANDEAHGEDNQLTIDISELVNGLEPGIPIRVPLEQMIYMEHEGMVFMSNIVLELMESVDFSRNNDYTKFFDYDRMKDNLIFRFRHSGDRMMVTSDGQTRKLKKELIDRKIPKESRNSILLLAADDEIYWAVGVRRSESSLIDGATKSILRVTFE